MSCSLSGLMLLWAPSIPELLLILAIVLVIFGAKKIPEIARGFGEGIRSFKEGMKGDNEPPEKK
ncbi:MAG TPA: twin-arginine translocase TatA/TatE family subunit [Candidatus Nitrosotenuis sp.]|nr:twin-arginine translocase TatA/TatE family subunit [Candidatus Nitrosotenuis sp.]